MPLPWTQSTEDPLRCESVKSRLWMHCTCNYRGGSHTAHPPGIGAVMNAAWLAQRGWSLKPEVSRLRLRLEDCGRRRLVTPCLPTRPLPAQVVADLGRGAGEEDLLRALLDADLRQARGRGSVSHSTWGTTMASGCSPSGVRCRLARPACLRMSTEPTARSWRAPMCCEWLRSPTSASPHASAVTRSARAGGACPTVCAAAGCCCCLRSVFIPLDVWAHWVALAPACRIFRFKLTDGEGRSCVAIESQPLPGVKLESVIPGTKVCLRGCSVRLGVVLLEPKNFEVRN